MHLGRLLQAVGASTMEDHPSEEPHCGRDEQDCVDTIEHSTVPRKEPARILDVIGPLEHRFA